jgi:hypothetical protein
LEAEDVTEKKKRRYQGCCFVCPFETRKVNGPVIAGVIIRGHTRRLHPEAYGLVAGVKEVMA